MKDEKAELNQLFLWSCFVFYTQYWFPSSASDKSDLAYSHCTALPVNSSTAGPVPRHHNASVCAREWLEQSVAWAWPVPTSTFPQQFPAQSTSQKSPKLVPNRMFVCSLPLLEAEIDRPFHIAWLQHAGTLPSTSDLRTQPLQHLCGS